MKKIVLLAPLLAGLVGCGALAPRSEPQPGLVAQSEYVESCAEVLTPENMIHVPVAWCDDNVSTPRYRKFWVLQGTTLPPYGQPLGPEKDRIKVRPSNSKINRHTAPPTVPQAIVPVPVPVQQSPVVTSAKPKTTTTKNPGRRSRW